MLKPHVILTCPSCSAIYTEQEDDMLGCPSSETHRQKHGLWLYDEEECAYFYKNFFATQGDSLVYETTINGIDFEVWSSNHMVALDNDPNIYELRSGSITYAEQLEDIPDDSAIWDCYIIFSKGGTLYDLG